MSQPGRVDAALEFIRHANEVRNPRPNFDGMKPESRDLTPQEEAVESAALEVLRRYFTGEANFGDHAPTATAPAPPVERPAPESAKL